MDANSLRKIEKTTGMTLVHIRSFNLVAELWFSRRRVTREMAQVEKENNNNRLQFNP
jgi:hypothetical protein